MCAILAMGKAFWSHLVLKLWMELLYIYQVEIDFKGFSVFNLPVYYLHGMILGTLVYYLHGMIQGTKVYYLNEGF